MADQNHYILSFEGMLFSHSGKRKYFFESPTNFDNGDAIVCLRSVDDNNKIIGYIRFDSSPKEDSQRSTLLLSELNKSLRLKGLVLKISGEPELRWIEPNGKKYKCIVSTFEFAYSIDVLKDPLPNESVQHIEELFKKMRSDSDLRDMGCDLIEQKKIEQHIGEFLLYWIEFNKRYNKLHSKYEPSRIAMYINGLNQDEIDIIYTKHQLFFTALSVSNITDRNGRQLSHDLAFAIKSGKMKNIIKKATLCVYGIRNDFVHENKLSFNNFSSASTFVRDLIYIKLLIKYRYLNP